MGVEFVSLSDARMSKEGCATTIDLLAVSPERISHEANDEIRKVNFEAEIAARRMVLDKSEKYL